MTEFYVIAVCHTIRDHEYITLWRPDDRGYTPVIPRAGRYAEDHVRQHIDYYHNGDHVAVPCEVIDAMGVYPKPGYFDYPGPAVPNTKANWDAIRAALIGPTPFEWKPEVYRKRRIKEVV